MSTTATRLEIIPEDFVARLSDAAALDTLRRGVRGSSVDVELEVWNAFAEVIGKRQRRPRATVPCAAQREDLRAELTDAAYQVALRHGIKGSFLDTELGLFATLDQALARC
jgi:hypothetical protein